MDATNHPFSRTERLYGAEGLQTLGALRVLLFGVGGVGSWCAEALIRSGVGHLMMVDPDCVDVTNINRQLPATTATVGRPKVEVLRERLLTINPDADIVARQERYSVDTAAEFDIEAFDCVVDAIDSLADKMELILRCTRKAVGEGSAHQAPRFYSSMGAARKVDPMQLRVSEFWQVDGCPLAASLRKRMRRAQRYPERKFKCVWSPEVIRSATTGATSVTVTAVAGMTLASLLLRDTLPLK